MDLVLCIIHNQSLNKMCFNFQYSASPLHLAFGVSKPLCYGFCCDSHFFDTSFQNLVGTVRLPASLYNTSEELAQNSSSDSRANLQLILYRDAKLFPSLTTIHDDPQIGTKTVSVVSAILSVGVCKY